jgi:hypothetical protein
MEAFKELERESKTKAFSRAGLARGTAETPEEVRAAALLVFDRGQQHAHNLTRLHYYRGKGVKNASGSKRRLIF